MTTTLNNVLIFMFFDDEIERLWQGLCFESWWSLTLGVVIWAGGFNIVYIPMIHSQAMEEHRIRQARIVDALEAEKRKISKELEEMQKKRALREIQSHRNGESFQVTTKHILEFGTTVTIDSI